MVKNIQLIKICGCAGFAYGALVCSKPIITQVVEYGVDGVAIARDRGCDLAHSV